MKGTGKFFPLKLRVVCGLILCLAAFLVGCATKITSTPLPEGVNSTQVNFTGKKVVFVNSYHSGYAWSDGVESGIQTGLANTGVELNVIHLDTKNHPSVEYGKAAGENAWATIQDYQPDAVIACDDNAQKYLVVPFMKGGSIPVVFAGVNWDASAYGYDEASNVTGVLEVEFPDLLVTLLKGYANGGRVGYLTIDTETERKVADIYNDRFFDGQMKVFWAKTQAEFQQAFVTAQQEVDILIMGNNAGSDQWDEVAMKQFILANIHIPTGSINDWMAPFTLLTYAKSAQEQGELAAEEVLSILGGKPPKQVPVVENKKGQLIVNLLLADKLDVVFSPSILKNAVIIEK